MGALEPAIVELEQQHAVAVHGEVPFATLSEFFGEAFTVAAAAISEAGAEIAGPPFGYYPTMPADDTVVLEAGFPVSARVGLAGRAHDLVLPAGRAVVAWHVGPYDTMEKTYDALQGWMGQSGLEPTGAMWECYLSDPAVEPDPATWITKIVWPIASG